MTSLNKAIEVLNRVDEEADFLPDNAAYAHALEAAGLLMPDLPESENARPNVIHFWVKGRVMARASTKTITLWDRSVIDSDQARELAYALLAAADYAEKEKEIAKR